MSTPTPDDGRSMLDRMRAGELYQADDPAITALATAAHEQMTAYNASSPGDPATRRTLPKDSTKSRR